MRATIKAAVFAAKLACVASLLVPPEYNVTAEKQKSVLGGNSQAFSVKNTTDTPSHSFTQLFYSCSGEKYLLRTAWNNVNNVSGSSLPTSPPRTRTA